MFRESIRGVRMCRDGSFVEEPVRCNSGEAGFLDARRRLALSKRLSGILRHYPGRYGVRVDDRGWASIREIVNALKRTRGFEWVEEWHIRAIASLDPKGRFEVRGDRIRARYGHTIRVVVEPLPGRPPEKLFHGTTADRLKSILKEGLKPMRRLMVHLTSDYKSAVETGRRHGEKVVVLEVDTKCVEKHGYHVRRVSRIVYIVERVPPECIRVLTDKARFSGEAPC